MSIVLGIDPGLTGALAWVEARKGERPVLLDVQDMPTVYMRGKNHLDLRLLQQIVAAPHLKPRLALVEQVGARPGQGLSSTFRFGYTAGATLGVLHGMCLDAEPVAPQVWRRAAGLTGDKKAALALARAYFPTSNKFARAMDHNRAEAALIAFSGALRFSN